MKWTVIMDDLQLLRATRNTTGTVPPAVLAAGRERLMTKAAEEDRRSLALVAAGSDAGFGGSGGSHGSGGSGGAGHGGGQVLRPRRPWRRVLAASAAAAAIVASVVTLDVVGSGDKPGATAEAAELLNAAAATTIEASDPVLAPGQYLLMETEAVNAAYTSAASGEEFVWLESQARQLYVPADRSAEWVMRIEYGGPVQFFDEASRWEAERQAAQRAAAGEQQNPEIWRGPDGRWQYPYPDATPPSGPRILGNMPLAEAIATAPRDPQALLELIYDYQRSQGKGDAPYEEAFTTIADTLREGVIVPADLRAALYQAAALIPGLTVVDEQATLDGRTGVSLGMPSINFQGQREIIIDPATGQMIGEREILLEDVDGIPAGTASSWTAVTTSVVDSAP